MAKKAVTPRKNVAKGAKPKQKDLKSKNIGDVKGGRVKGGVVPLIG